MLPDEMILTLVGNVSSVRRRPAAPAVADEGEGGVQPGSKEDKQRRGAKRTHCWEHTRRRYRLQR